MSKRLSVVLLAAVLYNPVQAQRVPESQAITIEGFWQDTARRILYSRTAPPSYIYGAWTTLDQSQTYPSAKEIRRTASGWEVVDLNASDMDHSVKTFAATERTVEFVRTVKWSGCAMHHKCGLQGQEMVCSLENRCLEGGQSVLDWRGEERYAKRASCERLGGPELQGFPVACRSD
jgi:hypothetical protein